VDWIHLIQDGDQWRASAYDNECSGSVKGELIDELRDAKEVFPMEFAYMFKKETRNMVWDLRFSQRWL
jgi:hypothetical protein